MMTNLRYPAQAALRLTALLLCTACSAAEPGDPRPVRIEGAVVEAEDLSALARVHDFWVLASDEGRALQRLDGDADPRVLRVRGEPLELLPAGPEIDLEALAADGGTLYALGSHSLKRRVPDKARWSKNRQRIETVIAEPTRNHLFRIEFEASGDAELRGSIDLRAILREDPVLGRFLEIPGKENGLDLEGLAVLGGKLYIGCRSPVLRDGWVPVIVLEFERPAEYELRYVGLGGDGIRSMARAGDELLIVSGDPARRKRPQELWFWNGRDTLPGREGPGGLLRRTATLPPAEADIEGLAVLSAGADSVEVLVVRDGGGAERLGLPRR